MFNLLHLNWILSKLSGPWPDPLENHHSNVPLAQFRKNLFLLFETPFSQHFVWTNLDHYALLTCGGFARPKLQIPLHFPTNKFKRPENHLVDFITAIRPRLSQIFWISYYSVILMTIFIKVLYKKKKWGSICATVWVRSTSW